MQDSIEDIIEYMPFPFSTFDIVIFTILALFFAYILIKLILNFFKPKPKSKKEQLRELKLNSKDDLFKFTKLAKSIDNSKELQNILKQLENYKYQKGFKPLPSSLKNKIKEYIKNV